jgi:hypothetical protein
MSWKNNEIKLSSKPQHDFLLLKTKNKLSVKCLYNIKKEIKIKK